MKSIFTFSLLLFTSFLLASADICDIDLTAGYHGAFAHGERAEFEFYYSTDEAAGVRIFGRPFTNGALTPGFGAHGSGLNFDEGTFEGWFTINSGDVVVDEIRVTIVNDDQSEILREFYIPVEYHFGVNGVHDFSFSQNEQLASMLHNEDAVINFDYDINHPGGARIFLRPFTDGGLTPGYAASGSPVYEGEGSAMTSFTITSGLNVKVDQIRVLVTNADQSETLEEFYLPVNWYWSNVKLTNLYISGPIFPENGTEITVNFAYEVNQAGGARIFPRPVTNGDLSPNYGACVSPTYSGIGTGECDFTITAGNHRVDHIRLTALSNDQSTTLLQIYMPVNEFFGVFPITNQYSCPPAPARLFPGEPINLNFSYDNETGAGARIFARPFTDGDFSPGYSASGSPAYATGNGTGSSFFTLNQPGEVDQIRFSLTNESQTIDHAAYLFDADYTFGDGVVSSVNSTKATAQLDWSVGPNPMNERATVRLSAQARQTVYLSLIDALGRVVRQWPAYELGSGISQTIELDRKELRLTNGMYFLRLRGADYVLTEQVVVQ
ncbi:hypothetical protein CEQ90_08065 [Lewinellaceae bacterium SD302]|nr:hypothetical protein CEQ90_08065 [Lewinellaceae bacterium SD302]